MVKRYLPMLALVLVAVLMFEGVVQARAVRLRARLSGAQEVPGPGDEDGTGRARIRANVETRRLCFTIAYENIEQPTGGHIHAAPRGQAGDVVVTLFSEGAPSPISDCVTNVARPLLRSIVKKPANYYVNIHNSEFEAGAIRGQLRRVQ